MMTYISEYFEFHDELCDAVHELGKLYTYNMCAS